MLASTLQLGALRVVSARAHTAADLAALVAVNDQDDVEFARTGRLVPASNAAAMARAVFADNLEAVGSILADPPAAIAAAAAIRVESGPSTVRISATVPVRTPIFGVLLFHPVTDVAIKTAGGAR